MSMNKIYKKIAKKHGVSVATVKKEMETAVKASKIKQQGKGHSLEDFISQAAQTMMRD